MKRILKLFDYEQDIVRKMPVIHYFLKTNGEIN